MAEYFREVSWQGRRFSVRCARKRAKCLRLRVLSGARVRLTVPYWTDEQAAARFLASKAEWIAKACDRMRSAPEDGRMSVGDDGLPSRVRLRGSWAEVRIDPALKEVRADGTCIILGTSGCTGAAGAVSRLISWLKAEAKSDFEGLCDGYGHLLAAMGSPRPAITVRDMRSLWGSCRPMKGSITLNLRLVHEDPEFTGYVVLHEIAHLRHPGHGSGFASFMDANMSDWRARRKLVRVPAVDAGQETDNM